MSSRQGEEGKVWFRSDRCFRVGTEWFVATREGPDLGPFKSRAAAEQSFPRYLKVITEQEDYGIYARKLALNGIWAANDYA